MEENVKNTESVQKLSYEQLEAAAIQLQRRALVAEEKLKTIDAVTLRLSWLFKVLEFSNEFTTEFVAKCAKEVEELLNIDKIEEVEPEEA